MDLVPPSRQVRPLPRDGSPHPYAMSNLANLINIASVASADTSGDLRRLPSAAQIVVQAARPSTRSDLIAPSVIVHTPDAWPTCEGNVGAAGLGARRRESHPTFESEVSGTATGFSMRYDPS